MSDTPRLLNQVDIALRWVDMDAYGHVNNARFFDFMTEARAQLLGELKKAKTVKSLQFVVVTTDCTFLLPYLYPDTVIIKQYLKAVGNSSFTLDYEFLSSNTSTLCATGHVKMVCYDPVREKAVPLPDSVKSHFE
jgi:acyl-CoA thioester hydrolase